MSVQGQIQDCEDIAQPLQIRLGWSVQNGYSGAGCMGLLSQGMYVNLPLYSSLLILSTGTSKGTSIPQEIFSSLWQDCLSLTPRTVAKPSMEAVSTFWQWLVLSVLDIGVERKVLTRTMERNEGENGDRHRWQFVIFHFCQLSHHFRLASLYLYYHLWIRLRNRTPGPILKKFGMGMYLRVPLNLTSIISEPIEVREKSYEAKYTECSNLHKWASTLQDQSHQSNAAYSISTRHSRFGRFWRVRQNSPSGWRDTKDGYYWDTKA